MELAVYLSLLSHLIVSSLLALAWAYAYTAVAEAAALVGATCLVAQEIVLFLLNTFLRWLFDDIILNLINIIII